MWVALWTALSSMAEPMPEPAPGPPAVEEPAVEEPARHEPAWPKVDKRAQTVYTVGRYTGSGGLAVEIVGTLMDEPVVALVGRGAQNLAPPMMAGSSLRSRRALVEMGAKVHAWPGYTAWGLWGASLGFQAAELTTGGPYLFIGTFVTRIGSYSFAGYQDALNARGRRELGRRRAELAPLGPRPVIVGLDLDIGDDRTTVTILGRF